MDYSQRRKIAREIQDRQYRGEPDDINLITPISIQVLLSERAYIDNTYIINKLRSMELPIAEISKLEKGLANGSLTIIDVLDAIRANWLRVYNAPDCYRLLSSIVQYYPVDDINQETKQRLQDLYDLRLKRG